PAQDSQMARPRSVSGGAEARLLRRHCSVASESLPVQGGCRCSARGSRSAGYKRTRECAGCFLCPRIVATTQPRQSDNSAAALRLDHCGSAATDRQGCPTAPPSELPRARSAPPWCGAPVLPAHRAQPAPVSFVCLPPEIRSTSPASGVIPPEHLADCHLHCALQRTRQAQECAH